MLAGLLQLENSNFEDALSFDAYGLAPTEGLQFWRYHVQDVCCNRVSVPPRSGFWPVKQTDGKNILLERLKTRKPPTEFQDVFLKTLCAVRARPRLQLEDFNVEGQATWCAWGFSLWELAFGPPFSGWEPCGTPQIPSNPWSSFWSLCKQ